MAEVDLTGAGRGLLHHRMTIPVYEHVVLRFLMALARTYMALRRGFGGSVFLSITPYRLIYRVPSIHL